MQSGEWLLDACILTSVIWRHKQVPSHLATGGKDRGQRSLSGGCELFNANSTETHLKYTFNILLQMLIAAKQFLETPEKAGFI